MDREGADTDPRAMDALAGTPDIRCRTDVRRERRISLPMRG
jgi:hypothetical protein